MGVFRQLGDPLGAAPAACLCQHHGAAYAEQSPVTSSEPLTLLYDNIADGATIVSQAITITERCCVVVNAASIVRNTVPVTAFEIERPLATIQTDQEDLIETVDGRLFHHAAWEILDPGTYTYYLVNRAGAVTKVYASWIKIIASDCEG